jgi:cupin fold WbuC family metalloprotein
MFVNTNNQIEVIFSKAQTIKIRNKDLNILKINAKKSLFEKSRFCCHKDSKDRLHEMIIFHKRGYYVRPHKHTHSSESIHIIKGKVDILLFKKNGEILDIIKMGDLRSNRIFYYRIKKNVYHSLLIKSSELIFHETTLGPFKKKNTIFAKWASMIDFYKYQEILNNKIKSYEKIFFKK